MNTTAASILGACILGAAAIVAVTFGGSPSAPADSPPSDTPDARDVEAGPSAQPDLMGPSGEARVAKLERELREARAVIASRHAAAAPLEEPAPGAETPAGAQAAKAAQARFFALGRAYADGSASDEEVAELLKMAKDKDLMARVVAQLDARIASDPNDVAARMQLVEVQSARLHSADSITERSMIRGSVQEQLTEVLERDPENWDANYMRAVGISHSQRTPQGRTNAIKAFQSLIKIQDGQARQPRFAKTYGQLAGVLLQEKKRAEAIATVESGLRQYPDDEELRKLQEKLGAQGD